MAWTSLGYDGTVNEVGEAVRSPFIGSGTPVVAGPTDFKVTINSTADRTLNIAPGTAWGFGVLATSDAASSVQLGTIASSNRWDAIVLRRDWTTNTNVITSVANTLINTKALPPGLLNTPGTAHDQILALVQVTAGQTLPTAVLDLRAWASKVITASDLLAIPTPTIGMEVQIGPSRYQRVLDANGNPAWLSAGKLTTVQAGSVTAAPGWTVGPPMVCRYRVNGSLVQWDLQARRTGAALRFNSYGASGDVTVLTLNGPRPDRAQIIQFQTIGGPTTTSTQGVAAWGYVLSDGRVVIESGLPDNYIIQRLAAADISLQATFTFMRES